MRDRGGDRMDVALADSLQAKVDRSSSAACLTRLG